MATTEAQMKRKAVVTLRKVLSAARALDAALDEWTWAMHEIDDDALDCESDFDLAHWLEKRSLLPYSTVLIGDASWENWEEGEETHMLLEKLVEAVESVTEKEQVRVEA